MAQDLPETPPANDLPAVVEKRSRFSIVWLIPILAAALGAWLFYKHLTEQGIPVKLTFETASGLEAGKTKVMFRDVQVGLVETIEVTDDARQVLLHVTIDRKARDYLRDTTRFWVVRPRITTSGVSGLGTLLSGAHITLEPGSGKPRTEFAGLETPPPLAADTPGRAFVLRSKSIASVGEGSPIYYRGLRAGEVLDYELDRKAGEVAINIFIHAPYDKFVLAKTQFWNASGIEVDVGAEGMSIRTESLEALLIGGIAFETPHLGRGSPTAKAGASFVLHQSQKHIDRLFTVKRRLVMYFEGSVRGLQVGAPVEIRGIRLGEVVDIDVEINREDLTVKIPVTVQIEPERLHGQVAATEEEAHKNLKEFIDRGLRGQLETGSLLTGQLFVNLVMDPDNPPRYVRGRSPLMEVPTIPTNIEALKDSLVSILHKVDQLPLDKLVQRATDAVDGFARLTNSPEVTETLSSANTALREIRKLLKDVDAQVAPLAKDAGATMAQLRKTLAEATNTLTEATKTLVVVEGAVGQESNVRAELVSVLREAAAAARSFRILANYLERHPEALLKGKPGSGGK